MRLRELLRDLDVVEWLGDTEVEVSSLTHDSRRVQPGACFACLPGARTDGHEHAAEALRRGARSMLVDRVLGLDVTQAHLADVRTDLGWIASRFHGEPSRDLRVLGVTGTNGKTTTVTILDAIGRAAGERVGVIGTLGPGELTTPEATELQAMLAEMREEGIDMAAMEVSSHALARHRVDGTRFAAACFTNLSHDHLDEHGSMEEYFAAKCRLFEPGCTEIAVTNLDDPFGARLRDLLASTSVEVVTYGIHDPDARVAAVEVDYRDRATTFEIIDRATTTRAGVASRLLGEINVSNQLAAAATALATGISLDDIVAGLEAPLVIPGRLERIDAPEGFTVLVDYAHTPDSLTHVLETARIVGSRVSLVFGCGGERDRAKRPMMGAIAARLADRVIVTSDNPRSEDPAAIIDEIVVGAPDAASVVIEADRRRAIERAIVGSEDGDVVVIAGKGHEQGQTVNGVTRPFDDCAVVRELLEARRCA